MAAAEAENNPEPHGTTSKATMSVPGPSVTGDGEVALDTDGSLDPRPHATLWAPAPRHAGRSLEVSPVFSRDGKAEGLWLGDTRPRPGPRWSCDTSFGLNNERRALPGPSPPGRHQNGHQTPSSCGSLEGPPPPGEVTAQEERIKAGRLVLRFPEEPLWGHRVNKAHLTPRLPPHRPLVSHVESSATAKGHRRGDPHTDPPQGRHPAGLQGPP